MVFYLLTWAGPSSSLAWGLCPQGANTGCSLLFSLGPMWLLPHGDLGKLSALRGRSSETSSSWSPSSRWFPSDPLSFPRACQPSLSTQAGVSSGKQTNFNPRASKNIIKKVNLFPKKHTVLCSLCISFGRVCKDKRHAFVSTETAAHLFAIRHPASAALCGLFWRAGEKRILTRSVEQREVKPCIGSEFSLNRNAWCT